MGSHPDTAAEIGIAVPVLQAASLVLCLNFQESISHAAMKDCHDKFSIGQEKQDVAKRLEAAAHWLVVEAAVLGRKPEPTTGGGGGAKSDADTSSPAFLHLFNCTKNAGCWNDLQECHREAASPSSCFLERQACRGYSQRSSLPF